MSFDTTAARQSADTSESVNAVARRLFAACDEIDSLRAKVAELEVDLSSQKQLVGFAKAEFSAVESESKTLQKIVAAQKMLIEGKDGLLVAYRTQRQPTEKTWKLLEQAEKALAACEKT